MERSFLECKPVMYLLNVVDRNDECTPTPAPFLSYFLQCQRFHVGWNVTLLGINWDSRAEKLEQPEETGVLSFHPVSEGLEGSTAGSASAGSPQMDFKESYKEHPHFTPFSKAVLVKHATESLQFLFCCRIKVCSRCKMLKENPTYSPFYTRMWRLHMLLG